MISAYNEYYFDIVQKKLASMCEISTYSFNINLDDFFNKFINSKYASCFENPSFELLSKSADEMLLDLLNKETTIIQGSYASPEYWVGWVIAYAQFKLNVPFKRIITKFKPSSLLLYYPTYHEMDITKILDIFEKKLDLENPLKKYRRINNLSQNDLALLSNVPVRNIRAYEQGTLDIAKAEVNTVYNLSKTLNCKIDDLIKYD